MPKLFDRKDLIIRYSLIALLSLLFVFWAAPHFALCSDAVYFIDFDTPVMFRIDVVNDVIVYGNSWQIRVPVLPGIRAGISEDVLKDLVQLNLKLAI
jgi:hypothetical protein